MSSTINDAMTIKLDYELPEYPAFEAGIRRAPRRESHLSEADKALAIKNALRYIHPDHHEQMAKEFAQELEEHGRIYGYRFRPAGKLYGKPIEEYKGNCICCFCVALRSAVMACMSVSWGKIRWSW